MLKKSIILLSCLLAFITVFGSVNAATVEDVSEAIGTVPRLLIASGDKNALYEECTLGDAVADAMLLYTGADAAIVNGGLLTGNLQPGEVTRRDIESCVAGKYRLAVIELTADQLYRMVEAMLSHVTVNERREYIPEVSASDVFPQVAGMRISYDPAAAAGGRISRIAIDDRQLDRTDVDTKYRLVSTVELLSGDYGTPAFSGFEELNDTIYDAFCHYVREGMQDYSIPENRIYAMEVRSELFPSAYTILTGVAVCVIFVVLLAPIGRKLHLFEKVQVQRDEEARDEGGQ